MEATAFFEKKVSLNAKDLNRVGRTAKMDDLIMGKLRELIEDKCSEHGFVLPGTLGLVSRSMGYFEPGRFTGDAVYYVKASGQVLYPADGVRIVGEVLRKEQDGSLCRLPQCSSHPIAERPSHGGGHCGPL